MHTDADAEAEGCVPLISSLYNLLARICPMMSHCWVSVVEHNSNHSEFHRQSSFRPR